MGIDYPRGWLTELLYSFIQAISIAPLQSSSPLLLKGTLHTTRILCRSFTPKRNMQLRVKDLPKVYMWRLERDSNPRPFGRKATNLQASHLAPQGNRDKEKPMDAKDLD